MSNEIGTGSFAVLGALAVSGTGVPAPASPAPAALPGTGRAAHHAAAATDVLQRAAQRVVAGMQEGGIKFNFTIDKQSGMTIVRIFNKATGELVRQIPSEEAVHVAQLLRQDEQRLLLDVSV